MDTITIWIELALSDLKSAKILYSQKQYRTSYFFFQQASEKANKALALKFGLISEDKLKDIGHNQLKIMRNYLVEKANQFDSLSETDKKDPNKFAVKNQSLNSSLAKIDKLRNEDLVNISTKEINSIYKDLVIFSIPYTKRIPKIKEYLKTSKESKNVNHIGFFLLKWAHEFMFIWFTLLSCAILTIQHSSLTRYPENGKDPLKIYTIKLPLIKKQLLMMELLENAIKKLKSFSMEPNF